jgi:hypothetical protein
MYPQVTITAVCDRSGKPDDTSVIVDIAIKKITRRVYVVQVSYSEILL